MVYNFNEKAYDMKEVSVLMNIDCKEVVYNKILPTSPFALLPFVSLTYRSVCVLQKLYSRELNRYEQHTDRFQRLLADRKDWCIHKQR